MTWKHLSAWLLLIAISIQWIGGVLYLKLTHTSLIGQAMDETEEILAEKLSRDYGIDTRIRILDEKEQEASLSAGYGAPFLFSVSDEDSTDYFTVDDHGLKEARSEYLINGPEKRKADGEALLSLQKLFSPYVINRAAVKQPTQMNRTFSGNFLYNPLEDLFNLAIPTPPPTCLA